MCDDVVGNRSESMVRWSHKLGEAHECSCSWGTMSGRNEGRSLSRQPCESLCRSVLPSNTERSFQDGLHCRKFTYFPHPPGLQHHSRISPRRPRVLRLPGRLLIFKSYLFRTSAATIYRYMIIFFSFSTYELGQYFKIDKFLFAFDT